MTSDFLSREQLSALSEFVLDREDILDADDLQVVFVRVPEWGKGKNRDKYGVLVSVMGSDRRDRFEAESIRHENGKPIPINAENVRARLVSLCVVGVDGQPLFTRHHVKRLGQKSSAAMDRVFTAALRVNGMTQAEIDKIAGNSDAAQSGDLLSASV